ncbi:MAG: hypothetical protein AAGF24_00135 [Cyanobacteria bacterium P01_H01_bin.121]
MINSVWKLPVDPGLDIKPGHRVQVGDRVWTVHRTCRIFKDGVCQSLSVGLQPPPGAALPPGIRIDSDRMARLQQLEPFPEFPRHLQRREMPE